MRAAIKTSIFVILLSLMGVSTVFSQESIITFGVKAGLNLSTQAGVSSSKHKIGYNLGVTVDFRLSREIYLLTGLEYTIKGARSDGWVTSDDRDPYYFETKEFPAYLQVPLHIGYMFPVSREVRLMFHAGPYVAYGTGGKTKWIYTNEETELDYFGVGIGKMDWGLGLGVNGEYNRFVASLGYDRGLRNFIPNRHEGKARTSNIYLSFGYLF